MASTEQPLACSLNTAERSERGAHLRVLSDASLVGRARDDCTLELRFRADDGVHGQLEKLVELESRCCPFLTFGIEPREAAAEQPAELVLRIAGPEGARGVIDAFDSLTAPR